MLQWIDAFAEVAIQCTSFSSYSLDHCSQCSPAKPLEKIAARCASVLQNIALMQSSPSFFSDTSQSIIKTEHETTGAEESPRDRCSSWSIRYCSEKAPQSNGRRGSPVGVRGVERAQGSVEQKQEGALRGQCTNVSIEEGHTTELLERQKLAASQ